MVIMEFLVVNFMARLGRKIAPSRRLSKIFSNEA